MESGKEVPKVPYDTMDKWLKIVGLGIVLIILVFGIPPIVEAYNSAPQSVRDAQGTLRGQ